MTQKIEDIQKIEIENGCHLKLSASLESKDDEFLWFFGCLKINFKSENIQFKLNTNFELYEPGLVNLINSQPKKASK